MKSVKLNVLIRFVCLLLLTPITILSHAQIRNLGPNKITLPTPSPINDNVGGYLESLPSDYSTTTKRYPLLIFTMGQNTEGSGSQADLQKMFGLGGGYIQDQIVFANSSTPPPYNSWPTTFSNGTESFQFIFVVPQFKTDGQTTFSTPSQMNDVINYMISHYANRIDTTRIYLTGNSAGGMPVWDYPGASSAYADRIAAIVPFSPVVLPSKEKATRIKNAKVAVWAFHNAQDGSVPSFFTTDFIKLINDDLPPPLLAAKVTTPNSTDHNAMFDPYTRGYTENGKNIYEWMLQYKQDNSTANAGLDKDVTLPVNTSTLAGSGTGPNGTASSFLWKKVLGPTGGAITTPNSANSAITGLVEGAYRYRLTITDNAGGTATDDVDITVYPARIQAETPNATTNTTTTFTSDEGAPAQAIVMSTVGSSASYNVNLTNGIYTIRLRAASNQSVPSGQTWDKGGSTITVFVNGGSVGEIIIPYTAALGFGTFTKDINLGAGPQVVELRTTKVSASVGSTAINWVQFLSAAAAAASIPTPVNFTLFNSNCTDGTVNLLWKTAGEVNTKEFSVEKSANGADWTSISTVRANGSPATTQSYSYRDNTSNNSYYRIVGIDYDGKKTQTSVIKGSCSGSLTFNVFPNPITDKATVDISLDKATKLQLTVLDSRGAAVKQQVSNLPKGNSQVTMFLNGLPNGTYTLNAVWDNENRSVKLIKK